MAIEWHYAKNGKQYGPVSSQRLRRLATDGELTPTDFVWKDGMLHWASAGKVAGLFENTSPPQLPLPPKLPAQKPPVDNVKGREGGVPKFDVKAAISSHLTHPRTWSIRKRWSVAIGALLLLGVLAGPRSPNAQCPICSYEFYLTEEFKGNISAWMRQVRCGRCGGYLPAAVYYKEGAGPPPDPLTDMLDSVEVPSRASHYYIPGAN